MGWTVIHIEHWWDTPLRRMDNPCSPEAGGFQWGPGTNANGLGPIVYVFSTDDFPNIRNTAVPELMMKFRSSFNPEPNWLDDPTWYDDGSYVGVMGEVKDSLQLDLTQR